MTPNLNSLTSDRCCPDSRSVIEDYERSRGVIPTRLGAAVQWIADATDADADAATAAADDDAATTTAAATATDAAAATTTAATATATAATTTATDANDADADADADAAAIQSTLLKILGDQDMHDGIKVIVLPGSYYGYGVTKVGWIRRVSGDEWEILPGAVTVLRTGDRGNLEDLAHEGLGKRYKIHGVPSKVAEHIHRLGPRRIIQATEGNWPEVKRPEDWRGE